MPTLTTLWRRVRGRKRVPDADLATLTLDIIRHTQHALDAHARKETAS